MTHWIIREQMNAVLLALALCLTFRFGHVWYKTSRAFPKRDAAKALTVLCFGESIRAGWAWLALAAQNKNWQIFPYVQDSYWIGILAVSVITIGTLCCIRVFSEEGNWFEWWGAIFLGAFFWFMTAVVL